MSNNSTSLEEIPYLIVGLGNPGQGYIVNRHNVGFMVLDHLANHLEIKFSRMELRALVTKAEYKSRRLILAKPQTYMNLSGQSVGSLLRYYKIPLSHLLIAYDDVDLPFETLRMRPSGGSAGQKGMRSIIENLGSQDIPRLRIGIGRPPGQMDASDYVLQNFSKSQLEIIPFTLDKAVQAILAFITDGIETAMNTVNPSQEST